MVSDNDMGAHDVTKEVGNTQKADSRYMMKSVPKESPTPQDR